MKTLSIIFTEFIPEQLEEGILYVSMPYSTIAHLCACGCKNEVITPLSPLDWSMTYNGKEISLHPSIGNWQFPCRSHYWIRGNKVVWAGNMHNDIIENNRSANLALKMKKSETNITSHNYTETGMNDKAKQTSYFNQLMNTIREWLGYK